MNIQQYLAYQLSNPTGILGRFVLGALWNRRNARLNDVTFEQLDLKKDDRVLDIGFGGGYLLGRIIPIVKRGLAAGVDVSAAMVENARKRYQAEIREGRVDIQQGQAESLSYPDGYFSKVSSVNSIFYWDDVERGFAEIHRVLRAEGKFVLTYTCKKDLVKKGFAQYGVKTFDEKEIREMLVKAGFREIAEIRERDQHREFLCVTGYK
jgi:SAM-dependent methyltransferase